MDAVRGKTDAMEQIVNYIKRLKFKKAIVGGIDQEDVYKSMRELVSMFTEAYSVETEKSEKLEKQLSQAEHARELAESRYQSLKSQLAQRLETVKADSDALEQQMEAEKRELTAQIAQLTGEREAAEAALTAQIEALTAQCEADAAEKERLKAELSEARANLDENTFERESLEDIYLDANRRRKEILAAAEQAAESMKRAALEEAVADQQRIRAEQAAEAAVLAEREEAISAKEETCKNRCDALLAEAESAAADVKAAAAAVKADAEAAAAAIVADAQDASAALLAEAEAKGAHLVEEAKADAQRRCAEVDAQIKAAQDTYRAERAKHEALLRRLGEARGEVFRSIQKDINLLQSLAFRMSGSGVETENIVGFSDSAHSGEGLAD